ncbi:MAG TPA: autotransporter domain-containing protein, partial [Phenylobacterium sp.]|nr:autotransporter domain-containing protein [Phenylobacterium sp.]
YLQLGPARDPRPAARLLERMLDIAGDAELARSAWVVLTSARTVPMWQVLVGADRLERALTEASRAGVRIGAIGAATAASLPGEHSASLVAPHPRAAALAEALRRAQPGGGTALFPGSSQALPTLPAQLRAHGWTVESAAVYETAPASQRPASADGLAADGFAGAASLASGAKIGLTLNSLLMNKASYTVVQADSLTSGVLDASLLGNVPYLYNASYAVDTTAGTLAIELSRKSASDLGLPSASAQAYEPLVQAINTDTDIRDAFLALQTRTGFVKAYNQMLPEHSGGVFQAVAAANDGFARAIDDRQGPDAGGVWLQETGYILTKDGSADDPGYKAGGFGVIGGAEVGAGRFGIVGASLGGNSSHVDPDGASSGSNLAVDTVEAGGYWRYVNGNLTLNARVAAAWLQATNHRAIYLLNDDQDTLLAKAVADGKWNGWAVTGRVAAAYEGRIGGFYARPSASVDYLRLEEDAYSEKNGGDAVDLHVSARQSSRSTGFAGLVAGKRYGDQDAWWGTEMTLGYR